MVRADSPIRFSEYESQFHYLLTMKVKPLNLSGFQRLPLRNMYSDNNKYYIMDIIMDSP